MYNLSYFVSNLMNYCWEMCEAKASSPFNYRIRIRIRQGVKQYLKLKRKTLLSTTYKSTSLLHCFVMNHEIEIEIEIVVVVDSR